MARRQTASAIVKAAKKRVPGLVRKLTTALRQGDCRTAHEEFGELSMLANMPAKFAWNTRPPAVVPESSLRRLRFALHTKCRLYREPYER